MRVLITGAAGLLGQALLQRIPEGMQVHATQRSRPVSGVPAYPVDLANRAATLAVWDQVRPELAIHTAAGMEQGARDIVAATRNVAEACAAWGAGLIHLSTDLVFDGRGSPYDEHAEPRPVMEYGHWKLAAEHDARAHVPDAAIVRTSLIVRPSPPGRGTAWLLDALERGERPRLFVDELRCPIADTDLAAQLWEIAAMPRERRSGVWNLVGPEALSRYALGLLVTTHGGWDPARLEPAKSPGNRPRDVRLLARRADAELASRARPVSEVFALEPPPA